MGPALESLSSSKAGFGSVHATAARMAITAMALQVGMRQYPPRQDEAIPEGEVDRTV
jgi:hypothetical protein